MIQKIFNHQATVQANGTKATPQAANSSFGALMQEQLANAQQKPTAVAFSKHAIARAEERGIEVTPALVDKLTDSVGRAQVKGAQNILAIDGGRAFIINVPNSKVVTMMATDEMKENVFTNIDGAVLL